MKEPYYRQLNAWAQVQTLQQPATQQQVTTLPGLSIDVGGGAAAGAAMGGQQQQQQHVDGSGGWGPQAAAAPTAAAGSEAAVQQDAGAVGSFTGLLGAAAAAPAQSVVDAAAGRGTAAHSNAPAGFDALAV